MKNKIKICLLLLAFVSTALVGKTQTDTVGFTLKAAQDYAMENSYVLQNTKHDITIAQKDVWKTV